MMVAWNIALDLKYVVQRARPVVTDPVSSVPGYSFPSGHAANSAAAATAIVIMNWPLLKTTAAKVVACTVASAIAVLTALDRVFLGVHFPSDVQRRASSWARDWCWRRTPATAAGTPPTPPTCRTPPRTSTPPWRSPTPTGERAYGSAEPPEENPR